MIERKDSLNYQMKSNAPLSARINDQEFVYILEKGDMLYMAGEGSIGSQTQRLKVNLRMVNDNESLEALGTLGDTLYQAQCEHCWGTRMGDQGSMAECTFCKGTGVIKYFVSWEVMPDGEDEQAIDHSSAMFLVDQGRDGEVSWKGARPDFVGEPIVERLRPYFKPKG
jgi:hypothetical protein